jgi:2-aminoadipate transaminase
VAKQNSDQCAGAFGQRLLEEYGRSGHLDRQIVESRRLYARRAELTERALRSHLPPDSSWTSPRGGFFTWVTIPGVDTVELSSLAGAAKVAYVPGRPFYPTAAGSDQLRLAYSRVADQLIDQGISRIGAVAREALHA